MQNSVNSLKVVEKNDIFVFLKEFLDLRRAAISNKYVTELFYFSRDNLKKFLLQKPAECEIFQF